MKYYDKVIADAFGESQSPVIAKCNGYKSSQINMSSICTKLIQETGRFCERYADDLLIDIARVKTICENMDSIEHEAEAYVAFGIRRDGVDSNSYIAIKIQSGGMQRSNNIINDYYRRIYCVKISRIKNSLDLMETVLELKDIQNGIVYNFAYDNCLEDEVPETWDWYGRADSMDTTIRFVDYNADGCGTDIVNIAILTGPNATEQVTASINDTITRCKTEIGEWTTDDILDAVSEHLESIGYSIRWVTPTVDIIY